MLVFKGDGFLDLLVFCTYPWIVLIAMCMEFSKGLEAFRVLAMVDEPTWRFWKQHNEDAQDDGWNDLETKWYSPLCAVVLNADVCAVRDPRCDQGANSQHELLK